jgi:hypothetical protein
MLAFHFTHIDNLDSILEHGLLSTNLKNELEVGHRNVANNHIQQTRSQIIINTDLKLKKRADIWFDNQIKHNLHDFVPFYFALKCPMLFQVLTSKNVDQKDIIFLAVNAESCLEELEDVYFSDASINRSNDLPNLYSRVSELNQLNIDEIENTKAVQNDTLKQQRMAEFLIKDSLQPECIDHIIVWNDDVKDKVIKIYRENKLQAPVVKFAKSTQHYYQEPDSILGYRKWSLPAVVGPNALLQFTADYYERTITSHKSNIENGHHFRYRDLSDLYEELFKNPDSIIEVSEAYDLTMNYGYHASTIQEHSYRVHDNLLGLEEFRALDASDQIIAKTASLLHDIGKGPASRWHNQIMNKQDFNHSVRSLPMLERILSTEIEEITKEEIGKLFICVTYDDLIGEIVGKGRDKEQLFVFNDSVDLVNLLFAVGKADMRDVHEPWLEEHQDALDALYEEAIQRVEHNA